MLSSDQHEAPVTDSRLSLDRTIPEQVFWESSSVRRLPAESVSSKVQMPASTAAESKIDSTEDNMAKVNAVLVDYFLWGFRRELAEEMTKSLNTSSRIPLCSILCFSHIS